MTKTKKKNIKVGKTTRWSSKKTMLVGIAVIFAMTASASIGYNKWKQADLNAQAAQWSYPWYVGDVIVAGCKNPIQIVAGGPVGYQAKIIAKKSTGWRQVSVNKLGHTYQAGGVSSTWWGGEVTAVQSHKGQLMSASNKEKFEIRIYKGGDVRLGTSIKPISDLPNCI